MRTVFQLLLLISFVFFSPLLFIVLAVRIAAPTGDALKTQLRTKDVYTTAIRALHGEIDTAMTNGEGDNPIALVAPFLKKELTASYIQGKAEGLIDTTEQWLKGHGNAPVLSFFDLKEKLIKQNKHMLTQLENAMSEMEAQQKNMEQEQGTHSKDQLPFSKKDIDTFLKSDFTIPIGAHIGWMKSSARVFSIISMVLMGMYASSFLCILLLAQTVRSKLHWVGWTLLFTGLWNIPSILLSTGSALVLAKTFTQNMTGAVYIMPFVEVFLTSIITTYARVTSASVVMLLIFSIGILGISLFVAAPTEPIVEAKSVSKKKR